MSASDSTSEAAAVAAPPAATSGPSPAATVDGPPQDELAHLLDALAHAIRNPLVSIKTFADLLGERFDDAEFRHEFYRVVSTEVGRIDATLEQLRSYASLPQQASVEVDLGGALGQVLAERPAVAVDGRAIEMRRPEQPVLVAAEPAALRLALSSIVAEAVAEVAADDALLIAVAGRRGHAVVTLAYQAATGADSDAEDDAMAVPRRVLGLGYTLARRSLARLGGELTVVDTAAGRTTVTVTIGG